MGGIEQATQAFVQEAREIVAGLEDEILGLEEAPSPDRVDAIFRGLHTVKGSGAMFGYTALARFTHHFENAYDLVRSGRLQIDRTLIDLSLDARDLMAAFLEERGDGPDAEALLESPKTKALIALIQELCGVTDGTADGTPASGTEAGQGQELREARRYNIRFRPDTGALRNGMRPDLLLDELCEMGTSSLRIDAGDLPPLEDLDPAVAYLSWSVVLETDRGREAIDDVFIFADDAKIDITEDSLRHRPGPQVVNKGRHTARDPPGRPGQ